MQKDEVEAQRRETLVRETQGMEKEDIEAKNRRRQENNHQIEERMQNEKDNASRNKEDIDKHRKRRTITCAQSSKHERWSEILSGHSLSVHLLVFCAVHRVSDLAKCQPF